MILRNFKQESLNPGQNPKKYTESIIMPEGRYYIGDLCYILDDELYEELCSLSWPIRYDYDIKQHDYIRFEGVFHLKSKTGKVVQVANFGTQYGDGQYSVKLYKSENTVGSLPVDSGSIGAVLIDDIDKSKIDDDMYFRTFKNPFNVGFDNGTIIIGTEYKDNGVYIETNGRWY